MIKTFFVFPTEENIKTNILKHILDNIDLHKNSDKEIFERLKNVMKMLEKTDFDLTKEQVTFDGVEYGNLIKTEEKTATNSGLMQAGVQAQLHVGFVF